MPGTLSDPGRIPTNIRQRTGTVATFDDPRGYGTIVGDDGGELFFHCTAIADGSRFVADGTRVAFDVAPGHGGRWEARAIAQLG
jgi:cold shock CspA family protein